mmetsp:Transcript_33137/g.67778  ORF Transcript_33137/g.67778 Transcript_33137/m.67778 type:complete len:511 (-) Transcript_33137:227-1759(-)
MRIRTIASSVTIMALSNGRWRSNNIVEVEATSSRQLKAYRYQIPVWYYGKDGPPPPPPPPPHAGNGHWVFIPSRPHWGDDGHKDDDDDNLKWEDDGHSDDDWTDDGWSDDGHKTASPTYSPTKSPKVKTDSPTAFPKTSSPTPSPTADAKTSAPTSSWSDDGHDDVVGDDDKGDDDGWDGDGHEILKPEPEEDGDEDDGTGDDDGDDDGGEDLSEGYEVICFENGSPVECEGDPIGTEVYYDYRYMVELSSASRRNLEDGSGTGISKKMESALLNQFAYLLKGDSPSMQALTRIVGPLEDEVASDEKCTSATEGNECYVMVGKLSAYMSPSAAVNEKEFICDIFSFLKYVVDNGDFSSVESLEAIEFLGSDNQYCWKEVMADSIKTTNEAEDSPVLSGGAIAGITIAAVASLLLAFVVARRRRQHSEFGKETDMEEEYEIDSIGDNFSVVSDDASVQADIVVTEVSNNEANEEEIEIQDSSILRNIDERFTIDEDDNDQISYTSDDLVSV